jgi:hypothetical protein
VGCVLSCSVGSVASPCHRTCSAVLHSKRRGVGVPGLTSFRPHGKAGAFASNLRQTRDVASRVSGSWIASGRAVDRVPLDGKSSPVPVPPLRLPAITCPFGTSSHHVPVWKPVTPVSSTVLPVPVQRPSHGVDPSTGDPGPPTAHPIPRQRGV